MIILDTTALIDIYKKNNDMQKILENIKEDLATTIINYQEIFFGLNSKDKKYKEELDFYEELFNNLTLINMDKNSVKKASSLFWELGSKGLTIGESDCLIAGICLTNNINRIVTKNADHFERIKGMEVISY